MVVLDTSVIIDHLRQQEDEKTLLQKVASDRSQKELAVSVISIQELYEGKSTADERAEELLLATVSPLEILPYTYDTAELAGKIARDLNRPIELADAAIAATTILADSRLLTLNQKDFTRIEDLELEPSEVYQ